MPSTLMKLIFNLYPPYWATGIHVEHISKNYRKILVRMSLRFYNRNVAGTHFGGSLFAMTDPFFMIMLIKNLGKNVVVWDKSSHIDFIKPGRGRVRATFSLSDSLINEIVLHIENQSIPMFPKFELNILDDNNEVVAKVTKTLYVRAKS